MKKRQYHLIKFGIKYGALAILFGFGCLYIYWFWMTGFPDYVGWMVSFIFLVTQVVGLIVPFTFLNSFFRNKILETESALRRRLRYLGATSGLFFIYLLAAFFIGNLIIAGFELSDTSFIVLIVLVLSITFSPLKNKVLRWLDEKLYPEKNKYKSSLKELIKRMSSFIEESQILENLSRWISETMGIYPIYAISIDGITVTNLPLKIHSPRSVLAKTKDGSNFYWDEILVIYTDGIEEFFNYQLEAFGVERMIKTFKENKRLHPKETIQKLFKELKNFAGGKESYHCDDLTIIVAKRID